MDELWLTLEHWLAQQLPEVLADLNPGCSNDELTDLEYCLNCKLPEDFKALYRRHNGQKGETTGLFCGLPFLCTIALYEQWSGWRELSEEDFATEITGSSYPNGAIKPTYINLKWIPLAYDGGGNHLGIDLDPGSAGVVGQVINFGRDEDNKFVLACSLTDFMAWMLTQYQTGNYQSSERSLALKEPPNSHFLDVVPRLFGRP
jgi:cell wall assembly regulator SMI1